MKFADNPTMLLVLQQLQEMYQLGFFGDNALADTFVDTQKHRAAGDYAMAITNLAMPAERSRMVRCCGRGYLAEAGGARRADVVRFDGGDWKPTEWLEQAS